MSPLPDAGAPGPSAEEDRARVLEMMGSPQMQRRLEEARAQREKVLAERAATRGPEPQDPRVRLAWDRELGSAGAAGVLPLFPGEEAPPLPWLDEPPKPAPVAVPASAEPAPQPAAPRGWLRSRASGAALGLIAGLALGTGLMRLAEPAPPGPPGAPEVAAAPVADAGGAGAAAAPPGPSALDAAPSPALAAAGAAPAVPPVQAPAGQPPGRSAPAGPAGPEGGEGGVVDVTGVAPIEGAPELPPPLAEPGPGAGVEVGAADPPAMARPGPLTAPAAPPPDPPLPVQNPPPGPGGPVDLGWQVVLRLPPHASPAALQEAQSALRAVGVRLIGTGVSRFGVAQDEVRFFHEGDAPDAARIAAAMGAQARDFSAYRPAPPSGTFEVWLVEDDPDARPPG